jgi:hypothetical protein
MPIPEPNADESRKVYIERCISDSKMNEEYPNKSQRFAVCNVQWTKSLKK